MKMKVTSPAEGVRATVTGVQLLGVGVGIGQTNYTQIGWSDIDVRLSHYRDRDQREIDVVLEHGTSVVGLEAKASPHP